MIRTVGDLLGALASICENAADDVVARTPHGTYTFEVANVHRGPWGGVVLDLREIPPQIVENRHHNVWDAHVLAQALSEIPGKEEK